MSFRLPSADGYIFDFNGTLFLDSDENREAWSAIFEKYRGTPLSEEEFRTLNGRTDEETVIHLMPSADPEKRKTIAEEKEKLYKELCLSHGLSLAPGAEEVLTVLSGKNIPIAIASSAPKMNMDWYIPVYGLERFFPRERIIAGRSDIPSKPDPAIFRLAMEAIGTGPERTVIFEDSASGVKGALASGAGLVVRIREKGTESIRDPRVVEIDSFVDIITEGL